MSFGKRRSLREPNLGNREDVSTIHSVDLLIFPLPKHFWRQIQGHEFFHLVGIVIPGYCCTLFKVINVQTVSYTHLPSCTTLHITIVTATFELWYYCLTAARVALQSRHSSIAAVDVTLLYLCNFSKANL